MNNRFFTKILLLLGISTMLLACNATKRVPNGKLLLTKNDVYVNGKLINNDTITANLVQKPNSKFLKSVPFYLYLYNMAKVDSTGKTKNKGFSKFYVKNGEAPVIISERKAKKTLKRLTKHYFNKGYFNTTGKYQIDTLSKKKGKISYNLAIKKAYTINSFSKEIKSNTLDSLYELFEDKTLIKINKKYNRLHLANERERLSSLFTNNGVFQFLPEYIKFEGDSIDQFNHLSLKMMIQNRPVKKNGQMQSVPFVISKINNVNIYTDHTFKKSKEDYVKRTTYEGVNFYSHNKLNYKPKALSDLVTIKSDSIFKEQEKRISYDQLYRLNNFKTISIKYVPVANDSLNKLLDVNIFLTPYEPFKLGFETEAITSNIQNIGLSGQLNFMSRNVFKGAESLNFGISSTVSSSTDKEIDTDFFNILEIGGYLSLNIPRILFFTKTQSWIPPKMFPDTKIATGINYQKNIGLDKQDFNTSIQYSWSPKKNSKVRFKLIDIQYIKNLRPEQFFSTYQSTFKQLETTALTYPNSTPFLNTDGNLDINQANSYIATALNDTSWPNSTTETTAYNNIKSIQERQTRLTQNDIILGSSYTYTKNNQNGVTDNSYSFYQLKIEEAGTLLQAASKLSGRATNADGSYEVLGVPFSHYIKTDLEYRKHWEISPKQTLAFRVFGGIAIPLRNANGTIPFSKSYFGGGTNFNRAWKAYTLGPGTTNNIKDFNEANMKLEANLEYRFGILGSLNGALFIDTGNIWMTNNNLGDAAKFKGFESLKDIAIGTGIGFRYNIQNLFVIRFDIALKTYDPSKAIGYRWKKNLKDGVFNFGINYPF
jgi:hypothetical protein